MVKKIATLLFTWGFVAHTSICIAKSPIQFAIVLDDMGNNYHDLSALQLPNEITFSILPYTPYAQSIAREAQAQGRESILHMPMQAETHNEKLGKGALMLDMKEHKFKTELKKAIDYLPGITGINNHMGSTLTTHIKPMIWTMETLNNQGLFFLDSRTTAKTIAESTAKISGTPALRRHVFLDNIKTEQAMEEQWLRAITLGESQPSVVIIAHPYPETMHFLYKKLEYNKATIKLVSLQQLLPQSERLAMAKQRRELKQVSTISPASSKQIQ